MSKKIAIMQPYFFPYIGYFQLINAVDTFVVYDNVQFTKKGWFHRNRLLFNGKIDYFTINIAKDSDYLNVVERKVAPAFFQKEATKTLRKIEQNYRKAPYFKQVFPLLEQVFHHKEENLFAFIFYSLKQVLEYLKIDTEIIVSSTLPLDHELKNKYRVFDIYKHLKATHYINPIGGMELYDKTDFKNNSVNLSFIQTNPIEYKQFGDEFHSFLSIIDVMMFNSVGEIKEMLENYELI